MIRTNKTMQRNKPQFEPADRDSLRQKLSQLADKLILDAAANSEDGSWVIMLDDIKEHFDMTITCENGLLPMLVDELSKRDAVSECIASEDCIEMTIYLAQNENAGFFDLMSLVGCNLYDVNLVSSDEDCVPSTIVELTPNTLTEQGKTDWHDVLSAKVERIFDGLYGMSVELSGVSADRIVSFGKMLAGYCSEEDYERWVNPDSGQDEAPTQSI